jgi:hypothetical protein
VPVMVSMSVPESPSTCVSCSGASQVLG